MKLEKKSLREAEEWKKAGYELPEYDLDIIQANTKKKPTWIHFGAGNIFRAFMAVAQQKLLNEKISDTGIIVCEGYDSEIIEKVYRKYDNLTIAVSMKQNGSMDKMVVGSVAESLLLKPETSDWLRLKEIFENPALQMATFTITEKGYQIKNASGYLPQIKEDMQVGPEQAKSYMGCLTALCYLRYLAGKLPLALVSMDNFSHNGDRLKMAVLTIAEVWEKNNLVEEGFSGYLQDETKISFPWSMIDKITPRPDSKIKEMLERTGLEGMDIFTTSANTYIAPFVNAEETEYLVIEDAFPNGKPALDKGGIIFTDRATVDKVEKMKVCTCLNPLHTALAIYGCLLGYTLISEEMKNPLLKNMVEVIGYKEGLPVVVNPGILDPKKFIDEVVNVRIPNPFLPDSPQRIATDTSQKLSIRFGETIKAYEASPDLHTEDLKLIPLVYAGWLRYLMGIDDEGREFTPSSDPLLEEARQYVADYELSFSPKDLSKLDALLANEKIFGVNLHAIGMDTLVKQYFAELSSGVGAVAAALKKYVPEKVTL